MIAIDQLPVGILLLELDGVVAAINLAAAVLFGQPREALIGSPGLALLHLAPDRWQVWRAVVEQGGTAEARIELAGASEPGRFAAGSAGRRSVQLLASLARHAGHAVVQVVALDASSIAGVAGTEWPARSDAVPAPVEDSPSAAKQRFDSLGLVAGGIAHDFNNLLVGVLAEASAAREDPALGEMAREALRRIEAAAGRMSQLTRQLLAYAGRGRIAVTALAPDLLLTELRDQLVRVVAAPAALALVPGAGPVVVEADPHLLRQVVINLVANASDAAVGRVEVASRILARDSAAWWQLEVSDDGAGIDPVTLARIFEPFYSTKPDRHGLGLSAVHGIVRRLGGDIEVDSRPGQGARFRIRLPIVPGVEPPPPAIALPSGPIPRLAGLRVLVADDEPSVRATVRRLLERRGATVVVAVDGAEAAAQLQDGRFELVIADVTMPGRTGYDVLAVARRVHPRLPVILMSGYTARVRGEGGEEEPDVFIEKPFTAKLLDAAIDEVLRIRG